METQVETSRNNYLEEFEFKPDGVELETDGFDFKMAVVLMEIQTSWQNSAEINVGDVTAVGQEKVTFRCPAST